MDETNPNSDVNIKVGAEIDVNGAANAIMSEFGTMEERLRRIGTEEAKALARQLQAVTRGLREGAFKIDDVEGLAQGFASITEDAQLSDRAIGDLSSKLSDSVSRSRQLSDYMNKSGNGATRAERAVESASRFLESKMGPAARAVSDSIGNFAGKIPGVQSLMAKMPALAGGIGAAFKAALVVAEKLVALSNEYKESIRAWNDRRMEIKSENATNDFTNRLAELDLADRKRREELASTKALAEAELELENIQAQTEVSRRMKETPYARERGFIELNEQRNAQRRRARRTGEATDEDIAETKSEKESLEKRRAALTERINSLGEEISNAFDRMGVAGAERSRFEELMENLEAGNIDEAGVMDQLKAKMGDWVQNIGKSIFGVGNFTTEQAEKEYKKQQDKLRQLIQSRRQMQQQNSGLDLDLAANDRKQAELAKQKEVNEASLRAMEAKWDAEEAARKQEIQESLANRKVELMGAGNRLTAMGLGGGNVAADYGRDIATNTKEMLAIMKENMKNYNRRGIAGDNTLNGPHLRPEHMLGEVGGALVGM